MANPYHCSTSGSALKKPEPQSAKKSLYNGYVGERNHADLKHPLSLNIGGYTFKQQSSMPSKKATQMNNFVGMNPNSIFAAQGAAHSSAGAAGGGSLSSLGALAGAGMLGRGVPGAG